MILCNGWWLLIWLEPFSDIALACLQLGLTRLFFKPCCANLWYCTYLPSWKLPSQQGWLIKTVIIHHPSYFFYLLFLVTYVGQQSHVQKWLPKVMFKSDVQNLGPKFASKSDVQMWPKKATSKRNIKKWRLKVTLKSDFFCFSRIYNLTESVSRLIQSSGCNVCWSVFLCKCSFRNLVYFVYNHLHFLGTTLNINLVMISDSVTMSQPYDLDPWNFKRRCTF